MERCWWCSRPLDAGELLLLEGVRFGASPPLLLPARIPLAERLSIRVCFDCVRLFAAWYLRLEAERAVYSPR